MIRVGVPSRQRGISLIELLIGVTIAGVLVSVGVPSMSTFIAEARLSAQTDQFVALLNQARVIAIKERRQISVCPVTDANAAAACSASAGDWSKGMAIWNGTGITQRVAVPSSFSIVSASTGVAFRGTIGAATAAASFTLCVPGVRQQQVDVSLAGHVTKRVNGTLCP